MKAYPIRYVITHIVQRGVMIGYRVATFTGSDELFETEEKARAAIDHIRANNSADILSMFGVPDTLDVRQVHCYPNGDPLENVFDPPIGQQDP